MGRITQKDLENLVNSINIATNNNVCSHTKNADGTYTTNIGTYLIDCAYGGVALHQSISSGGVREVFSGHMPKRELFNKMHAFLSGIYDEKNREKK